MSEWRETEFCRIPYDWNFVSASDFCGKVTDGTHDSPKQQITGKHLITSKHIKGRHIDFENAYLISQSDYEKINERSKVDQWNVIISMIGEYCGFSYVERNEKIDYAVKNVGIFKTQSRASALWLHYYIQSKIGREYLESVRGGTSQPYLSLGALRGFPVLVPTNVEEQKSIAAVLSSLDDKIDLLHRQNQTLESMAANLFRQWFVEPARAGEPHAGGEAQEDWEVRPLSCIANFLNGLACQKHPPKNELEKLPVLKIKELSGGISESSDFASSEIKPEYIVEAGDVIFAWSASLMVKVWDGERCVLNQHLFKVTSTEFPKWFYLMWCKHHLAEFISISASHATTMGHIKRGDLDAAMVSVPPENELRAMSEQMTPLLDKKISISKQIRTLEKLRDTLLPKLMSGEVRVALA